MPPAIKPLHPRLQRFLVRHDLIEKFEKQARLFLSNPRHPSLRTELMEPKHLKIYSFRVDRKYRAIFIYLADHSIEIIDINRHYNDWTYYNV